MDRWYFTNDELENTPSRKKGVSAEKELGYRQQSAKLIQDMGQKLVVNQLAINTAIVYMHRFYMYHSFTKVHRHNIAPAALFLAAKVEEQPRKLEHVIKVASVFISHDRHMIDAQSDNYTEKANELVAHENVLLQTLGFDVAIDHPHTYVVKCFQMVRALTNLPQTSYFMATNSLHMTTMCLQYKPAVVACVCIDIVCRWGNYEIQRYTEGQDWFVLVDPTVTAELLEKLSAEFITVLDKFPNRLKKFRGMNSAQASITPNVDYRQQRHSTQMNAKPSSSRNHETTNKEAAPSKPTHPSSTQPKTVITHKEYFDKKEKDRRERLAATHPVSSTSQRAHIDQLRMPPPQALPLGRSQPPHREPYPRKEHVSTDKHERTSEHHESQKSQNRIHDNHDGAKHNDKTVENHDTGKSQERMKNAPIKHKIEKVEVKNTVLEANSSRPSNTSSNSQQLSMKEILSSSLTDSSTSVAPPHSTKLATPVSKKEPTPAASQSTKVNRPVSSNIQVSSLYHPRLDGKAASKDPVSLPQPSSGEQASSSSKHEKYHKDVTTIPSISQLISQSMVNPPTEENDAEPAAISSTSHISRNEKHEHSHKHEKEKKKKKNKHKSKDRKERHKEKEPKEHKKSKKQKKHKEKEKVREKDHIKSMFDVDSEEEVNTPIKLTILRGKGVYTPEASNTTNNNAAPINDVTTNNLTMTPTSTGAGGLKITIPKSRLQSNTPQASASPSRGIPSKSSSSSSSSSSVPNVKLKLTKEKPKREKESRKRDRSPTASQQPSSQHSNKYLRTAGGINVQKVLDYGRWSSQGP